MPYSYNEVGPLARGQTLAVPFPYLSKDHVHVYVGGEAVNRNTWSWSNDQLILIGDNFPSVGPTRVARKTPRDPLYARLTGQAVFEYESVNRNDYQLIYILQEMADDNDALAASISKYLDGLDLEAISRSNADKELLNRIINLAVKELIDFEDSGISSTSLARYADASNMKNIAINGSLMSGGGFPRSAGQEIQDVFTGGNPTGELPRLSPTDLGEVLIMPPTEESTNLTYSKTPWMPMGEGTMHRVMPVDIRTCLFNTPVGIPIFKPVKTDHSGILSFRYIGEKPIHTVLSGSITALVRTSGTSDNAYQRLILRLLSHGHPTLEHGQNRGIRNLATSVGAFSTVNRLLDYREFNDHTFPVSSALIASIASAPNLYESSLPGFFQVGDTSESLRQEDSIGPITSDVRTTDWMDISAYDPLATRFVLNFEGVSLMSRIQTKDAEGNISTYNQLSADVSALRVYRFPREAKQVRIYYTGRGSSVNDATIKFAPLNGSYSSEYDPLAGYWALRTFNVCRDVVFWPGTEYWFDFLTDVYDGASAREWGFRYQSGGLRFLFDAGSIRKQLASNLFEGL